MGRDYATELLEQEPLAPSHEPTVDSTDYAGELFNVERHFETTEEISTITAKPIVEFTGRGGSGASFWAHLKAGIVDDPITKAKIYAADRFPDLTEDERMKRYRLVGGEVVFKDMDNKWYSESPDMFHYKLKRFLGATAAHTPAIAMGVVGAMGGPELAALGAAGGEGIRKTLGATVFDEPQKTRENISAMFMEAAFGAVGEISGRGALRGVHKTMRAAGGRKAAKIAKIMQGELEYIDIGKAIELKKYYKERFGVDLFDAQSAESRRLLDKINLYGDMPATADLVQSAKRIQDEQAHGAVEQFFNEIFAETDKIFAGRELSQAANSAVKKAAKKRSAKARPFYKKAFADTTEIDITAHLKDLDTLIEQWPLNSAERSKLVGFRKMLFREERIGKTVYKVPEGRIRHLDRIKKSTDTYLKPKVGDAPVDREVKKDIRRVKNNILSDIDKVNPNYQKARQIWQDTADDWDVLTNKTLLTDIGKLEGDRAVDASRKLFKATGNSPEIVSKIRKRIVAENPEAWDASVRVYLEDIFESVSGAAEGNAAKVFNNFWRKTVGNERQKKILKAAMSDQQFKNLSDFADLLRRVGMISRRESTTATRIASLSEELLLASTRPLRPYRRIVADRISNMMSGKASKRLTETLLSPDAGKHLARIKRLGVGTQKGVRAFSTFLSLVAGGEFKRHGFELVRTEKYPRPVRTNEPLTAGVP